MSDTISITIEEQVVEVTVLTPTFVQINLLQPTILPSIADNTEHRLGDGSDHADVEANTTKLLTFAGGTTGQHLAKIDNTDFNTEWVDPPTGGGAIRWNSPIDMPVSGTITPIAGDYFTATSKLIGLTGSAGEIFLPALSGETDRKIWGYNAGADIDTIIDTSLLGIGEPFAIGSNNGEGRILIMDSTGDLVLIGQVPVPMGARIYRNATQLLTAGLEARILYNIASIPPRTPDAIDLTNNSLVMPRAGVWNFSAGMMLTLGISTATQLSIYKNNDQLPVTSFIKPTTGALFYQAIADEVQVSVGDVIESRAFSSQTVTINPFATEGTFLSGTETITW